MLKLLKKELQELANPKKAELCQRFFKTGEGEYGEGDVFLGLSSQQMRDTAKKYELDLEEIQDLLNSEVHEHRQIGLFILIDKYKKENSKDIFDFYLANIKNINNWDLVDLSAPKIIGDFLLDKDRGILYELTKSENLWEKRISIISCFAFIKNNEFEDALKIAEMLLKDSHDLIHKAVGWMLREVGKRDENVLKSFLKQHSKEMPRTMLRYAIEKFEEEERKRWLKGEI